MDVLVFIPDVCYLTSNRKTVTSVLMTVSSVVTSVFAVVTLTFVVTLAIAFAVVKVYQS